MMRLLSFSTILMMCLIILNSCEPLDIDIPWNQVFQHDSYCECKFSLYYKLSRVKYNDLKNINYWGIYSGSISPVNTGTLKGDGFCKMDPDSTYSLSYKFFFIKDDKPDIVFLDSVVEYGNYICDYDYPGMCTWWSTSGIITFKPEGSNSIRTQKWQTGLFGGFTLHQQIIRGVKKMPVKRYQYSTFANDTVEVILDSLIFDRNLYDEFSISFSY